MLCIAFLRLSISLLRLSSFSHVWNIFLTMLRHFMMAALKHLSDNFNISVILVVTSYCSLFILFEIFLVLGIITLKKLNHGYLGYYVKLWVLFQLCILAGFLWNCFNRERVGFYCKKWVEIQASYLAFLDTQGYSLLLLSVGRSFGFPRGFHNTSMAGKGRSAWLLLLTWSQLTDTMGPECLG